MYRTVVTICTASLTFSNSTFCPHGVFMCFVWIWEQTAIISPYSINWLVCITETECVYCAVKVKVNISHYRPGQALRTPGVWDSPNYPASRHIQADRLSAIHTGCLWSWVAVRTEHLNKTAVSLSLADIHKLRTATCIKIFLNYLHLHCIISCTYVWC
jgi:hypothetical protein